MFWFTNDDITILTTDPALTQLDGVLNYNTIEIRVYE
jgi:hypothetical protein